MKHHSISARIQALAAIIVLGMALLPGVASATWDNKVRSFSLVPSSQTSLCTDNFLQTVRNIKSIGANRLSIVVPWSQQSLTASELFPYRRTPTDEALACGINHILSEGLDFGINFVINAPEWRAYIDPQDRDAWFRAYGELVTRYARDFAQVYGARHLSIGTEMYRTVSNTYSSLNEDTGNRYRWPDIINDVRSVYSGTITYSAQHSGDRSAVAEPNDLMPNVDVLGLSAYFALYANELNGLQNEWLRIENEFIQPAIDRWGKQIWVTELGYRPCDFTFERPYQSDVPCDYNPSAQATAWEAFLRFFEDRDYFLGLVGGWAWEDNPQFGGVGDTRYTVWNQPAADTFRAFWPTISGGGNTGNSTGNGNSGSVTVSGNTISWSDSGWYQVQSTADFSTVCEGGTSCQVASGSYVVINHSTGQRTSIDVSGADGGSLGGAMESVDEVSSITVTDSTIRWPADGWYQVQSAADYSTACEGGVSCQVAEGSYIVINHSTGQRHEVEVSGSSMEVTGVDNSVNGVDSVTVTNNQISWPDNGWYQVQSANDYSTVCEGGTSCEVANGTYIVINHSTGQRTTDVMVTGSSSSNSTGSNSTSSSGAETDFPFGESQLAGVPYCDPSESNLPDHGWGDLANYGYSASGCIHQSGNSDNPSGDPARGAQL